MNEKKPVLIRLASKPAQPGMCKGCGKPILWMETLAGKRMPMNRDAMPRHQGEGVDVYDAGDAHWGSCSARVQFDKLSRAHAS